MAISEIERLIRTTGGSLSEIREAYPKLITAAQEAQMPKITTLQMLAPEQAKAQFGIDLEPGWTLKLTPQGTDGQVGFSLITPDKWEITQDDIYISPQGQRFTREELEGLMALPAPTEEPTMPEAPAGWQMPGMYGLPQTNLPEGWTATQTTAAQRAVSAQQAITDIFPEQNLQEVLDYAQANPDQFIQDMRQAGRNPATEALLKFLVPDIGDTELRQWFGQAPPEFADRLWMLPTGSYSLRAQEKDDLMTFAWQYPDQFRQAMLYETYQSPSNLEWGRQELASWGWSQTAIEDYLLQDKVGMIVRGEWLPEPLEDYWRAYYGGSGEMIGTLSGLAKKAGAQTLADKLEMIGLAGSLVTLQMDVGQPYSPQWVAKNLVRAAPMMMALIILGRATGGVGATAVISAGGSVTLSRIVGSVVAGLTSTMGEGVFEASAAYNEALKRGLPPAEASAVFNEVFRGNVALLSGTNTAQFAGAFFSGVGTAGFLAKALMFGFEAVSEGMEEGAQLAIVREAFGDVQQWDAEMWQNVALGMYGGLGFGALGVIYDRVRGDIYNGMTQDQKDELTKTITEYQTEGLPMAEAESRAWDDFAATTEGQELITTTVESIVGQEREQALARLNDTKQAMAEIDARLAENGVPVIGSGAATSLAWDIMQSRVNRDENTTWNEINSTNPDYVMPVGGDAGFGVNDFIIDDSSAESLLTIPANDDILKGVVVPNWIRTALTKTAKIPGIGKVQRAILGWRSTINTESQITEDIVGSGAIVYGSIKRIGANTARILTAKLRSIISNPVKFFGFDEYAYSSKMKARLLPQYRSERGDAGTLEHVFTHPEMYDWTNLQPGLQYVTTVNRINKSIMALLRTEGVGLNVVNERWIHRVVTGKTVEGEVVDVKGKPGKTGQRPGAVPSYKKPRTFATMAEGIQAHILYSPNIEESIGSYVEEALKEIAGARFMKMVDEFGETPGDRLKERYPEVVERAEQTKVDLADAAKFHEVVLRAKRGEKIPAPTLNAIERRFPELGRRLRRLIEARGDTSRRLIDLLKKQEAYIKQLQQQAAQAQKTRPVKGEAAPAKAEKVARPAPPEPTVVPDEEKMAEAFRVMAYEDRLGQREFIKQQIQQIEEANVNVGQELGGIEEFLSTDPVALYRAEVTYETRAGIQKAKKVALTDLLKSGEVPETLTPRMAQVLLMGRELKAGAFDKGGNIRWEYIIDELADHFHMEEQELVNKIEQVARMKERASDFRNMLRDAKQRTEQLQRMLKVLNGVDSKVDSVEAAEPIEPIRTGMPEGTIEWRNPLDNSKLKMSVSDAVQRRSQVKEWLDLTQRRLQRLDAKKQANPNFQAYDRFADAMVSIDIRIEEQEAVFALYNEELGALNKALEKAGANLVELDKTPVFVTPDVAAQRQTIAEEAAAEVPTITETEGIVVPAKTQQDWLDQANALLDQLPEVKPSAINPAQIPAGQAFIRTDPNGQTLAVVFARMRSGVLTGENIVADQAQRGTSEYSDALEEIADYIVETKLAVAPESEWSKAFRAWYEKWIAPRLEKPTAEATPEVIIPPTAPGAPEAGSQVDFFGYQHPVQPKGKGKVNQLSMQDQADLIEYYKEQGITPPENIGFVEEAGQPYGFLQLTKEEYQDAITSGRYPEPERYEKLTAYITEEHPRGWKGISLAELFPNRYKALQAKGVPDTLSAADVETVINERRVPYQRGVSGVVSISQEEYLETVKTYESLGLDPPNTSVRPQIEGIEELNGATDYQQTTWSAPETVAESDLKAEFERLASEAKSLMESRKAPYWQVKVAKAAKMAIVRQAGIGEGYLPMPFAGGKIYNQDFIDASNKFFGIEKGSATLSFIGDAAGILRITKASLDFSPMMIQGLVSFGLAHTMLVTSPRIGLKMMGAWYKALGLSTAAFFTPGVIYGYIAKNMDAELQRLTFLGSSRAIDFFDTLKSKHGLGKIGAWTLGHIPLDPFGRAELVFYSAGEIVRNEFWKIQSPEAINKGKAFELARHLDLITGLAQTEAMGVPLTVRQLESAFMWFAPNYTRACLTIIADIFRGGYTGAKAKQALGGMMTAGVVYYVGIQMAISALSGDDDDETWRKIEAGLGIRTDPITGEVTWKPLSDFLGLKIGNYTFAPGGFWYGMVRLAGNILECINEVGDKERVDLLQILKNGRINRDNPFVYWWYTRASPLTGVGFELASHKDFLGYPIETPAEYAWYIATRFEPIWMEQGLNWLIPGGARKNEIPEDAARAAIIPFEIFGWRSVPESAWARFYDKAQEYIKQIPRSELDPKQIEAWEKGTLGWGQLTELQRQNLVNRYPELAAYYEDAQNDSKMRESPEWEAYTSRIDEERAIYYDRIDEYTRRLVAGEIDTREYRELCSEAGQNYGSITDSIQRDPTYAAIFEYFERKQGEGSKYQFTFDLALAWFETNVFYADDSGIYLANGDYNWDERDRRIDQGIEIWGMELYESILAYQKTEREEKGVNPLWLRKGQDVEKLGREYWRLPYQPIKDMTAEDYAEGSIPAEHYSLWQQYQNLLDVDKEAFLEAHPELSKDWRIEYRKANPEADAMLALWGYGGRLQTREGYNLIKQWGAELGIPLSQMGLGLPPETLVDDYFNYNDLSGQFTANSAEAKLWRLDHQTFTDWAVETWGWEGTEDYKRREYYQLQVQWRKEQTEYDALDTPEARTEYYSAHLEFRDAHYKVQAWDNEIPDGLVDTYVKWYTTDWSAEGTYADDWFLMDNKPFYDTMYKLGIWSEPKDFTKVPTREVWQLYEVYQGLPKGDVRLDFRARHPDLDAWLVLAKGYQSATDRGNPEAELTPWEELEWVHQFQDLFP